MGLGTGLRDGRVLMTLVRQIAHCSCGKLGLKRRLKIVHRSTDPVMWDIWIQVCVYVCLYITYNVCQSSVFLVIFQTLDKVGSRSKMQRTCMERSSGSLLARDRYTCVVCVVLFTTFRERCRRHGGTIHPLFSGQHSYAGSADPVSVSG